MDENKTLTTNEETETANETAAEVTKISEDESSEALENTEKEVSDVSAPADSETSDDTEAASSEETVSEDEKKKGKRSKLPLIILSPVILILILAFIIPGIGILPQSSETGEKITLRFQEIPLISSLYEAKTDLSAIDTKKVEQLKLPISLFGILPLNATVNLRDTTPPTASGRDVTVPRGELPSPEDFIAEANDITVLTYSFVDEPDINSGGAVEIAVTDEGGNTVNVSANCTVSDVIKQKNFELGVDADFIGAMLMRVYGLESVDLSRVDTAKAGVGRAMGVLDGKLCAFDVQLNDTTAPTADIRSFDLLLGDTITESDIAQNISDASAVTIRCEPELDLTSAGYRSYTVHVEDQYGNRSTYTSDIRIHALEPSITIEAGTSAGEFLQILADLSGTVNPLLNLAKGFDPGRLEIGTHETVLVGDYSSIPFTVTVEDTLPPEFSLRRMTVYVGYAPTPADLVTDYTDASDVDFKFAYEPDVSKEGNLLVTVIATDAAGNTAERSTTVKVSKDNIPPIIYGVKNIVAYEGETISFRSGVYAIDDKDGRITVKADSSKVNVYTPGTYYVTYTAADTDGNTAKLTAQVVIKAITKDVVNEKADAVLSSIISYGMTDREKARAIYDWCTGNLKYSTSTSYLMGYFNKAAFSGFTRRYGNCYTYYAVASALLTRAGITNTVIQRNDPRNPHYWNLVMVEGNWYHLDTCPQPSPHRLEVFLLTDSQLKTFTLDYYYKFSAGTYPATP